MSRLHTLLEAQGGHFVWADAVRAGVTRRELRAAERAGDLARVGRCAYIAPRRLTDQERHLRRVTAMLRARDDRVATHHSAAILHGMDCYGADLDVVHFGRTDTSGRREATWVLHRVPSQIGVVRVGAVGLEVAAVSREAAAVQTAMHTDVRGGLVTIDSALRLGGAKPAQLAATRTALAEAIDAYSRARGIETARAALALADHRHETAAESLAAHDLQLLRIPAIPQWQITVANTTYRADFRIEGTNVLIEIDGEGKYEDPDERAREKRRQAQLQVAGYQVVRIAWADLGKLTKIRAMIDAALAACAGKPLLP